MSLFYKLFPQVVKIIKMKQLLQCNDYDFYVKLNYYIYEYIVSRNYDAK